MADLPWGRIAGLAFGVTFALAFGLASMASADLLFESRSQLTNHDDERTFEAFRVELERLNAKGDAKVRVRPADVLKALNRRMPRHGHFDSSLTSQQLFDDLADAFQSYTKAQYRLAEQQFESALAQAHENPSLVVANSESRQLITRALVGLALARARLGNSNGSLEAMSEQLRSYPELPVTEDDYGPDGSELYDKARKRIDRLRRGSLLIETRSPDARIFINEFGRGRGGIFSGDLVPGTYRVLVEIASVGRVYDVEVRADEQTRLQVDWATDSVFVATKRWLGFSLPGADSLAIVRYAGELALKLHVDSVMVVSIDRYGPHRYLSAVTFAKDTGALVRSASVKLDVGIVNNNTKIAALTQYASRGLHSEWILPLARDRPPETVPVVTRERSARGVKRFERLTLILGATAVASLLAGGALVYLGETNECGNDDVKYCIPEGSIRARQAIVFSVAVATATSATILYLKDRRATRSSAVSIRPRRGGAIATLGWSF